MLTYGDDLTAAYRPDGLRAWKESGGVRTYYLYDGDLLVAEMDEDGAITAVQTWGADGLVSRGNILYLYDPLGNVAHRVDATNGNLLSNDIYDAWGNLLATKTPAGGDYDLTGEVYGYKGQFGYLTDRETELILCTFRYYDPQYGRWLTRDPIGYDGDTNLYQYCGNNPIGEIDPSGLADFYLVHLPEDGGDFDIVRKVHWKEAVKLRLKGESIATHNRRDALWLERKAYGRKGVLYHNCYEHPAAGRVNFPHYQSKGRIGHSFYDGEKLFIPKGGTARGGTVVTKRLLPLMLVLGMAAEALCAGTDIHNASQRINEIDEERLANMDEETRKDFEECFGNARQNTKEWANRRKDLPWWKAWIIWLTPKPKTK